MKLSVKSVLYWTLSVLLVIGGIVLMAAAASMAKTESHAAVSSIHSFDGVTGLDIRLGDCSLELIADEAGDECSVALSDMSYEPEMYVRNGTLVIEEKMPFNIRFLDLRFMEKPRGTVSVHVPQEEYDEIALDLGLAPQASIAGITVRTLEFDAGAGDIVLTNVHVLDDLIFRGGAGKCSISGLSVDGNCDLDLGVGDLEAADFRCGRTLNLDCGIGTLDMTDIICGEIDLDTGIGDVTMRRLTLEGAMDFDHGIGSVSLLLTGAAENYGLRCEIGIGSIRFNGNSVTSRQGTYPISIQGGIGDITIETAGE